MDSNDSKLLFVFHISAWLRWPFLSGRQTIKSVTKINPSSSMWVEVCPMQTPRRGLGVAILDGILYAIGGSDGIAALNEVINNNLYFLI